MYLKNLNPQTNRKVNINSKLGKNILKRYLDIIYGGSSNDDESNDNDLDEKLKLARALTIANDRARELAKEKAEIIGRSSSRHIDFEKAQEDFLSEEDEAELVKLESLKALQNDQRLYNLAEREGKRANAKITDPIREDSFEEPE